MMFYIGNGVWKEGVDIIYIGKYGEFYLWGASGQQACPYYASRRRAPLQAILDSELL